jgi:hypothetical protein
MRVTDRVGLSSVTMPTVLRHMFATALQDADVDPLIRNRLMGHAPATSREPSAGLRMTAVYSYCRPETFRRQLESSLAMRPALERREDGCGKGNQSPWLQGPERSPTGRFSDAASGHPAFS